MTTKWIAAAALAFAIPALAHHGWSEYDQSRSLTLTGKIVETGYEHPHGHVKLETPGKTWLVVLAPPSRMQARGVLRDQLTPGARVTVIGFPHKSRATEMKAEQIRVGDKTTNIR